MTIEFQVKQEKIILTEKTIAYLERKLYFLNKLLYKKDCEKDLVKSDLDIVSELLKTAKTQLKELNRYVSI